MTRNRPAFLLPPTHLLFFLGHPEEAYEIDYEVLIGERKCGNGFVESQMNELKDSKAVAMMGIETGVGFAPFGGPAYEVFKISKDRDSPVRAAAAKELATDRDPKSDAVLPEPVPIGSGLFGPRPCTQSPREPTLLLLNVIKIDSDAGAHGEAADSKRGPSAAPSAKW